MVMFNWSRSVRHARVGWPSPWRWARLDIAESPTFQPALASTCDSPARRSRFGGDRGTARADDRLHLLQQLLPRIRSGTMDASASTARSGSSCSTKNWSRTSALNSASDRCMSCWRATFSASAQRWSNIWSAADDVQHRPGQRFVEAAGLQLRRIGLRPGPLFGQLFGRRAGERPHVAAALMPRSACTKGEP